MTKEALGLELRLLRATRRLTQEKASELMGISTHTLFNAEKGSRSVDDLTLAKIAEVYDVSLRMLLELKEDD